MIYVYNKHSQGWNFCHLTLATYIITGFLHIGTQVEIFILGWKLSWNQGLLDGNWIFNINIIAKTINEIVVVQPEADGVSCVDKETDHNSQQLAYGQPAFCRYEVKFCSE